MTSTIGEHPPTARTIEDVSQDVSADDDAKQSEATVESSSRHGLTSGTPVFAETVLPRHSFFETVAAGMAATSVGEVFTTAESGQVTALLKTGPTSHIALPVSSREKLTSDRTYYVRDDGKDTNDGLSNTADGAFKTVQRGIDAAYALDCNGFTVTIQLNDGDHEGPIRIYGKMTGATKEIRIILRIVGNEASPASVRLTATDTSLLHMGDNAKALLAGMELRTLTSGDNISLRDFARLEHRNVIFGPCAREHIFTSSGAVCEAVGPTTVTGNAFCFCHSITRSLVDFSANTLIFVGEPDFACYLWGVNDASIKLDGATIIGRPGSGRVLVHVNGILNVSSCNGIWTSNTPPRTMTGGIISAESQMRARTLYVSTQGNDANDGFASERDHALRTIQSAIQRIATFTNREAEDPQDVGWKIALSAGTFAEAVVMQKLPCRILTITGAGRLASLHTVVRSFTNEIPDQTLVVQNMILAGTSGGQSALNAKRGAIHLRKVRFDTAGFGHMLAQNGGIIEVDGAYDICAELGSPPQFHMYATTGGMILNKEHTHSISGTVAFKTFAYCDRLGIIRSDGAIFSGGAVTGKRYDVRSNGVIDTNGADASLYPGSTAGTAATGGQYV